MLPTRALSRALSRSLSLDPSLDPSLNPSVDPSQAGQMGPGNHAAEQVAHATPVPPVQSGLDYMARFSSELRRAPSAHSAHSSLYLCWCTWCLYALSPTLTPAPYP